MALSALPIGYDLLAETGDGLMAQASPVRTWLYFVGRILKLSAAWIRSRGAHLFCRPRGLPIGNLTSQFWSNCYLHSFDLFIKRELGCKAYLRYVDDFALFANSKELLWEWKAALKLRLAELRLTIHDQKAQVLPTVNGVPWLGFIVYPKFRKIKARKVRHATHRLGNRYHAYCNNHISFAEFDASVQGWINHVCFADSWGLRRHMLKPFRIKPGDLRQKNQVPLRGTQ